MSHSYNGEEKAPRVVDEQTESQHTLIPRRIGGPPKPRTSPKTRAQDTPILRYRHRAMGIIAFYIPILVVPWVLTCVLAYYPMDLPSYIQTEFTESNISTQRRIANAIAVLSSFASIATIPLISALIVQAAVVYTQRRRKNQTVSVSQVFALADRGWSNINILCEAWPPWKSNRTANGDQDRRTGPGSVFLWLAALFLLIRGIQQPIREGFVSTGQILVITMEDNLVGSQNGAFRGGRYTLLGVNPEPDDMSTIPEGVVVQQLENSLASLSFSGLPTNLWPDLQDATPFELRDVPQLKQLGPWAQPGLDFFVAAFPNGTTTGILRHRAM